MLNQFRENLNFAKLPPTKSSRGFSLLESLIALAFLALAAFAVVATFLFASRLDTKKEARQEAALIALDSLEESRALLKQDFDDDVTVSNQPSLQSDRFKISRVQVYLSKDLGIPQSSLKEVTVTVSWESSRGNQSYVLSERFLRP